MTLAGASRSAQRRAWLAVALWTALVFTLSSDAFSASATGLVLEPIIRWLFPGISDLHIERIHFAIRKAAHLTEYGVLALLTLRALRQGAPRPVAHSAALALVFVLAVASADELHQSRSALRTGSPVDVAIDGTGGALSLAAALLWQGRFGARSRRGYGTDSSPSTDPRGARAHAEDV